MNMENKKYTPHPIDTSGVELPSDLLPLVEALSKNVHEVWSEARISHGWTYGEHRDDITKKHPCLIPYDELGEDEKDFDRKTSTETLKLILKLGFKISRE